MAAVKVKSAQHPIKVEIKSEVQRTKVEQTIKTESTGECKKQQLKKESELKMKLEPRLTCKVKKQVKQALGESQVSSSCAAALLQRGLELRKLADAAKGCRGVKRESGQRKGGSTRKRRVTRAVRQARREVMSRCHQLSPELAAVLGKAALSRPEAIKQLWAHCKGKGLLNPGDRREIVFDDELVSVFGKPSARLADLHSLLAPHFMYGNIPANVATPAKAAAKAEHTSLADVKRKREYDHGIKAEVVKKPCPEHYKVESPYPHNTVKFQHEMEPSGHVIRVRSMDKSSVTVEVALAPHFGNVSMHGLVAARVKEWHLIAMPLREGAPMVTARCISEIHETADGDFEECLEARLAGLEPGCSYQIAVLAAGSAAMNVVDGVRVPQRATPRAWSREETSWWAGCIQIPQMQQKVQEHNINGEVLFGLGLQDLRDLGLTECLAHRVKNELTSLRALAVY